MSSPSSSASASSPPAMTGTAECNIADLVEYHADIIVKCCEEDDRVEHWRTLTFFWELFCCCNTTAAAATGDENTGTTTMAERSQFGAIANRRLLAEILMIATHVSPYQQPTEDDNINNNNNNNKSDTAAAAAAAEEIMMLQPMVTWEASQWAILIGKFRTLRENLLRKDAGRQVMTVHDEVADLCEERVGDRMFKKHFNNLMARLLVQEALSVMRCDLEYHVSEYHKKKQNANDKDDDVHSDVSDDETLDSPPSIEQSKLDEFRARLDNMEDQKVKNYLEQFVATDENSGKVMICIDIERIARIMESDACHLKKIQGKITDLIVTWHGIVFPNGPPALVRSGYDIPDPQLLANTYGMQIRHLDFVPQSEQQEPQGQNGDENQGSASHHDNGASDNDEDHRQRSHKGSRKRKEQTKKKTPKEVREMRHARESLQRSAHDPLEESCAVAEQAVRQQQQRQKKRPPPAADQEDGYGEDYGDDADDSSPPPKRAATGTSNSKRTKEKHNHHRHHDDKYKKKRSAQKLTFDDSDVEEEVDAVRLSGLPTAPRAASNVPSTPDRKPKGLGPYSPNGRRRIFSDEEKEAIRRGVRRWGVGKWVEIKEAYPHILQHRSNVQIKDCYRTMVKRNEA